jgi:small basic protein (TIGR04137 family)
MSLDRSLKAANALIRHRNVLTRTERLEKLTEEEKWSEGKSVFGLPKVAHRKMTLAKEVKEEVAADGTTPAAPGTAAAGAAPGAPATGGKAPAAKGAAPAAAAAKAPAAPAAKKK